MTGHFSGPQRHSAGNIDYDNIEGGKDEDGIITGPDGRPFRARSKTVSDGVGTYPGT